MYAAFTRRRQQFLVPILTLCVVALGTACRVSASTQPHPVTSWVRHHAVPLSIAHPAGPLDDMEPLRESIGEAEVVGLGESVHGSAEEQTLKHRTLRFLVERMGFRSIAWEDQWTVGRQVNDFIRTGEGDLPSLMRQMSGQWQTREVADVLRWLRAYNSGRDDKVSFVGVEYYLTGLLAYDAIEDHVARTAPERLPDVREHLEPIRPSGPDIYQHIEWYDNVPDQEPYIRHARKVYEVLESLPVGPEGREHALALHHARQIASFYEHYHLSDADALVYRDTRAAANVRWWREFSGDKIAYWAASPHTANAPRLRIAVPPEPDMRFPSAGSYLRKRYGERYLSIGYTFDQGTVSLGPGETTVMPPPRRGWFEHPLGTVGIPQFAVDLREPAPPSVRDWLDDPIATRGLPHAGPDSFMSGGTLSQWFDLIVHRQHTTPTRPLDPSRERTNP